MITISRRAKPARWRNVAVAVCAIIASGMLATAAGAQTGGQAPVERRGGLSGQINDESGSPVRLATVSVDGHEASVVSDDSGRFHLRGLPAGRNGFFITRIGFAPVSFETDLIPDSVLVVSVRMRRVQTLDAVDVRVALVNERLAKTGFIERQRLGLGTFLTPAEIDSLAPRVTRPSELLRGVPGLDVRCGGGAACTVSRRRSPDCLWLFIDGVPHGMDTLDLAGLTPGGVSAIEVYARNSGVPLEFQGKLPQKQGRGLSTGAGCGALVIWTKSKVP